MSEHDKVLITSLIRSHKELSRIEIHRMTKLRPASISKLTKELLEEGRIVEAGRSDNPVGRKQVLLRANPDFGSIVSVDFDAEHVRAAVLDLTPRVRGPVIRETTTTRGGAQGLVLQLLNCAQEAIRASGVPKSRVLGVSVGDPGLVNSAEGVSIFASTIDSWSNIHLRHEFEVRFGKRTLIANNTRSKTVAERVLGAGEGAADMIFVEYGRGIGAGIITGGRILEGARFAAGEFGHTHVMAGGPPCRCGSFGCLEAIASVGALEASARQALVQGGFSQALSLAGNDLGSLTGWHVLKAAHDGDKMAVALVEEIGSSLGLGLANLVNLFNPALVVLDRRLALAGDQLLEQIQRVVQRQALRHVTENLEFRFARLGDEAALLGPALMLLEEIFDPSAHRPGRGKPMREKLRKTAL